MTFAPDPEVWFQKRPGGPWYKTAERGRRAPHPHDEKVCPGCGHLALIRRGAQFCSKSCKQRGPRTDSPGYWGAHKRVRSSRGPAKDYTCVDCGHPARDWSQRHGASGAAPEDYDPRCRKCHVAYDEINGENHGNAKLTDAQRRGIQLSEGATQDELAKHFGLSQQQVSKIRNREV